AWDWVELLPHALPSATPLADLAAEVERRARARTGRGGTAVPGGGGGPRALVLLVDGAADLRTDADLARVLRAGTAEGVHVLCLDTERTRLPAECAGVLELAADGSGDAVLHAGGAATAVTADAVAPGWAGELARALA
ncbi:hypothetical protein GTR00_22575, partial [Kineococcus sp. T90]